MKAIFYNALKKLINFMVKKLLKNYIYKIKIKF
jgi:hypothetical protein